MSAYLLLLVSLYLVDKLIENRKHKTVIIVVLFSLFMGLRNPLSNGADTISYYNLFERIKNTGWESIYVGQRVEHGFLIYVKLCSVFINNPQWFFVLSAFLMFIPLGMVVYKYSASVIQSAIMFIGFSLFSFYTTGFRQAFAISICMLAFLCIENKKLIRFILLVLLAMTFHKSAIVFMPAYWIGKLKSNYGTLFGYGVATLALITAMPWLAGQFNDFGGYEYVVQSTYGGIPTFICIFLITVLWFCEKDNIFWKNEFNLTLYNIQLVTTILWISRFFNIMAERLSLYYFVYIILTVPNVLNSLEIEGNKRIGNALSLIILLIFMYKMFGGLSFMPQVYEFFWQ